MVPPLVLQAFGLPAEGEVLAGGQGTSVRHGPAVLKPVDEADLAAWTASLLSGLNQRGFRVPRPLPARDGRFVVDGWAASEHVVGKPGPQGRWAEILTAGRAFHEALATAPRPGFLDRRAHRWAVADRVAWQEAEPELHPSIAPLAQSLLDLWRPVQLPAQLVHGDLAGNVLFPPDGPPVILDFSPYWRPAAYADAIVVIDGMLWYEAAPELVGAAAAGPDFPQLLLRALLFRLIALNEQLRTADGPANELAAFVRVFEELRSGLSAPR